MTLEETIDKAILAFLSGEVPEKLSAIKPSKYSKKYFDDTEENMFPSESATDKKKKVR